MGEGRPEGRVRAAHAADATRAPEPQLTPRRPSTILHLRRGIDPRPGRFGEPIRM